MTDAEFKSHLRGMLGMDADAVEPEILARIRRCLRKLETIERTVKE